MVLDLYMDKAGPDPFGIVVTVAAIATPDDWQALIKEWDGALDSFEQLEFFHMTDYAAEKRPYHTWRDMGVRDQRYIHLLSIIEKHVIGFVGASIEIDLCRRKFGHRADETALAYTATHCMMALRDFGPVWNRNEEFRFTIESGDQGYSKLKDVYDKLLAVPAQRAGYRMAGTLGMGEKRFPPLQVADIIAWESARQLAGELSHHKHPSRKSFRRLWNNIPRRWMHIDEAWVDWVSPAPPQ